VSYENKCRYFEEGTSITRIGKQTVVESMRIKQFGLETC
jgi:hypothetical protein